MFIIEYINYFIDFFLRDPLTQIMGFMGMFVILLAYFQKCDTTVKKLMLLSSLFWGAHFYLLGTYSWLAAVVIWVFRLLLSIKFERNKKAFLSILTLTIIVGYFTYDGIYSLLPVITSISGAYSYFFLEKVRLRMMMLFNSVTWLLYNSIIGSISGIINEFLVQVILMITIYRMLHPEWGSHYYVERIKQILWKRRRIDYDRFVFLHNRITHYRAKAWQHFLRILHYDLRTFFQKKRTFLWNLHFHKKNAQ